MARKWFIHGTLAALVACGAWRAAPADEPAPRESTAKTSEGPDTLGGMQFWNDEYIYGGWRIQRNVLSEHCRLLNEHDERMSFGTYDECRAKFGEIKTARGLPPLKPKAVILLHGLFGFRGRMEPLAKYLHEHSDYEVVNVGYASTRGDLTAHAGSLAKVVDGLEGVTEINFVAHSRGNLIVRRYLAGPPDAKPDRAPDRRLKRMVMLAPPNQGAKLAVEIGDNGLARLVSGLAAKELGVSFDMVRERLATPEFEFGILAACCDTPKGGNPALSGDDDWVVRVEETKLAGARDFLVLPAMHQTITQVPQTHECVLRFLQQGFFTAADRRQALSAAGPAEKKP